MVELQPEAMAASGREATKPRMERRFMTRSRATYIPKSAQKLREREADERVVGLGEAGHTLDVLAGHADVSIRRHPDAQGTANCSGRRGLRSADAEAEQQTAIDLAIVARE